MKTQDRMLELDLNCEHQRQCFDRGLGWVGFTASAGGFALKFVYLLRVYD